MNAVTSTFKQNIIMVTILIADSGSTKAEWCLLDGKTKRSFETQGISPYFLTATQIQSIIEKELVPKLRKIQPTEVFFY